MKTFNQTELKAARTILKELFQKGKFHCLEVHVATVTLKALNILIINGYETAGLKLSSFTEDEQEVVRGIVFIYGYGKMHFAGDKYFSVVMDDFDFNSSTITKLLVELFKRVNYSKCMKRQANLTQNPTLTTLAAVTFSAGAQNLKRTATSWQ